MLIDDPVCWTGIGIDIELISICVSGKVFNCISGSALNYDLVLGLGLGLGLGIVLGIGLCLGLVLWLVLGVVLGMGPVLARSC